MHSGTKNTAADVTRTFSQRLGQLSAAQLVQKHVLSTQIGGTRAGVFGIGLREARVARSSMVTRAPGNASPIGGFTACKKVLPRCSSGDVPKASLCRRPPVWGCCGGGGVCARHLFSAGHSAAGQFTEA